MKYQLFLTGVLCLYMLAACDNSGDNEPDPVPQFPVVNVGDAWVMTRTDTLQSPFAPPDIPPDVMVKQDTIRVLEQVTLDGETWYRIENGEGGGAILAIRSLPPLYSFREDGIYQLGEDNTAILIVPYSDTDATEYKVINGVFGRFVSANTLVATETLGQLPASLYRYRFTTMYQPVVDVDDFVDYFLDSEHTIQNTISPELGLVKLQAFWISESVAGGSFSRVGSTHWELVAYIPATGATQ